MKKVIDELNDQMEYIREADDYQDTDVRNVFLTLAHDEWIHAKKLHDTLAKMMEAAGIKTNPLGLEMWNSWQTMIDTELIRIEGCYNKVAKAVKK